MNELLDSILNHMKHLETSFQSMKSHAEHWDYSNVPADEIQEFNTLARALIERASTRGSAYSHQCQEILDRDTYDGEKIEPLFGVVRALRTAFESGYLRSITELIHAELFSDFLEMADHLHQSGFKDPAAVVAGSALEAHLRKLCEKHRLPTETETTSGLKATKADRLNADLCKADVYTKLDQKSVTAWLDLRNKAAHGEHDEYTTDQVALLIEGVRNFISRHAA